MSSAGMLASACSTIAFKLRMVREKACPSVPATGVSTASTGLRKSSSAMTVACSGVDANSVSSDNDIRVVHVSVNNECSEVVIRL